MQQKAVLHSFWFGAEFSFFNHDDLLAEAICFIIAAAAFGSGISVRIEREKCKYMQTIWTKNE
jgi:hypothetical protein